MVESSNRSDDASPTESLERRAVDGRIPGRRGKETRARLLERMSQMLEGSSYRELKVVDIAREADTSPATFYQYFNDVEAAILSMAEDMAVVGNEQLTSVVRDGRWDGAYGLQTADNIARAYIQFWEDNRPLMRVIDLSAEQGDQRFRAVRVRLLNEFTVVLADTIRDFRSDRAVSSPSDEMAVASVLVSMLAHVASHRWGFEHFGIKTDDLRVAMAQIVYTAVTAHSD